MEPESTVDIADRMSRKRLTIMLIAALAFLAVQLVAQPVFVAGPESVNQTASVLWVVNVVALLLTIGTGGGLLNRRQLRALVEDDVARAHRQLSIVVGYWVAMVIAVTLYVLWEFTGKEVAYLTVTISVLASLFSFSYLEFRAHRDA
jgi:hypothetical protein